MALVFFDLWQLLDHFLLQEFNLIIIMAFDFNTEEVEHIIFSCKGHSIIFKTLNEVFNFLRIRSKQQTVVHINEDHESWTKEDTEI